MCTATVPLLWMLNRFAWRCAPWPVTPAMENDLGFLHAHQKRTARINTFLCKVAPRSATPIPRLSLARAALAQCGIQIMRSAADWMTTTAFWMNILQVAVQGVGATVLLWMAPFWLARPSGCKTP